ncbi:hypothetical protein CDD83_6839 [Cordyceps sp. RAO-2017]|nr:hypothetical protein CDD83_6839 [Cordyceps sp. RAO-2017]
MLDQQLRRRFPGHRSLVALYLKKIDGARIVIDGLDECSDVDSLLLHLRAVVGESQTNVSLSSRPSVTIDSVFSGNVRGPLWLEEGGKFEDIETYLRPPVQDLARTEKLIVDHPDLVCRRIA